MILKNMKNSPENIQIIKNEKKKIYLKEKYHFNKYS